MRKYLAQSILFILTIILSAVFANQVSAKTTVDDLIFDNANKNITDILAPQVSTTVVINEIYGGGGCTSANCSAFNRDYVELFNKSGADVNIGGFSIQYSSATATATTAYQVVAIPAGTIIPAGGYYLIGLSANTGSGTATTTISPDLTGTISASASAGKFALVSNTTPLTGCPIGAANVIDYVGYGATANCSETAPAPAPSGNFYSIQRIPDGTDTDNNSADFRAATGTPKTANSVAGNTPPTITNIADRTTPVNTATGNISFTIGDAETLNSSLTVTATSSNQTLVPNANITLGGTAATRNVNITPAPNQSGTTTITVTVSDGTTTTSDTFVLTVTAPNSAPTITSASSTTFTQGTAGSFQVTATGNPAPTFSTTGPLPSGVTLPSSGLLSGTPTQSGTFTFTITATNGTLPDAAQTFTLTVNPTAAPPSFSIRNVTQAEGNSGTTNFVFTVTKTGTTSSSSTITYTTADGSATAGSDYTAASGTLTFAASDMTMAITIPVTGDVVVEGNETFTVTITAGTNATVSTATGTGTITNDDVAPTIVVNPTILPNGTVGTAYSQTISATGGTASYTFAATGNLPTGLTIAPDGTLNGTPTALGTFNFTITATDANNFTGSRAYSITIDAAANTAPAISDISNQATTVGTPITVSFTVSDAETLAGATVTATSSDTGVAPNPIVSYTGGNTSGMLSINPAATGQTTITVRVTDAGGLSTEDTFVLTVNAAPTTPGLSVNDVTLSEGNAGTTIFSFTVSLSSAAPAGGVTFDIATADGTANAGIDYTARALTGQTIPAGSSTYTFDVAVNGDTAFEPSETFFANVTNVTGATLTDGQGLGTIINDDGASTIVVNPNNPNGFFFFNEGANGSGGFVFGPVTPPLGTGSAFLTVDNTGQESLGTRQYAGTRLADITTLQYSAFRDDRPTGDQNITITLAFDVDYNLTDGNTAYQDRLVYEPAANGITVTPNVWNMFNTLDLTTGKFYSSSLDPNNPGIALGCTKASPCTKAQLLTAFPNVGIRFVGAAASNNGVLLFRLGGTINPNGLTAYVDALTVGVNGVNTTFNFEPLAPTAATVKVGGRVRNALGRGISRALIRMTNGAGVLRSTYTNSFGYYNFADVEVGQSLIFEVKARRYNFIQPTQVVSLTEESTTVNFTAY